MSNGKSDWDLTSTFRAEPARPWRSIRRCLAARLTFAPPPGRAHQSPRTPATASGTRSWRPTALHHRLGWPSPNTPHDWRQHRDGPAGHRRGATGSSTGSRSAARSRGNRSTTLGRLDRLPRGPVRHQLGGHDQQGITSGCRTPPDPARTSERRW